MTLCSYHAPFQEAKGASHARDIRFGKIRLLLRRPLRRLFGVLAAWFMGKDGWGWSEGGKLFAWFGCLFWLIVWVVMVVTGGIAAFLGMLF